MTRPELKDTELAADYIGFAPGTMENWRSQRRGPKYLKLNNSRVYYRRKDLDEWLEKRIIDPEKEW